MSLFPRDRVSEALHDSANRGIALVVAPAGFGKSVAVIDAFGKAAHWIETPDGSPTIEIMAREVIAAAAPETLRALSPLLARSPSDENRQHLTDWVAAHLRSVELPIVFEDFQNAADPETLRFIRDLIQATVPHVRWVLVSRETPELPIGTWLARDYMTLPLTTDDLAFDVEEATGVAAAMSVPIESAALADLVANVSGWPMAVRLSLGAWERTRALPSLRIRTRGVLFDFLEGEIWQQLTGIERDFFKAAAHLNELRPRILTAAGFPESRLSLEQLHRRLPLLSKYGNGTFRLHELFRDFILERSEHDDAANEDLVRRLARALERFGSFEEAVSMHIRIEDWDGAVGILARHGIDRIENGRRAEIAASLARFPAAYRDHPVVTGLRGYALAMDGTYDLAKREIDAALGAQIEASLRGPLALQSGLLSFNARRPEEAIPLLRAAMSDERYDGEIRMKAAAGLAMACAVAGDESAARDAMVFCASGLESNSIEVRALVRHRLAYAHLCLGEYSIAEHYANESAQLAHSIGLESLAARAYSILQNVAAATYADTMLTRRYAESVLRSAESSGDRSMEIFALQSLILLACEQGDDECFERTNARLFELQGRPAAEHIWVRFANVLREAGRGKIERAIASMRHFERSPQNGAVAAFSDAVQSVLYAAIDPARAEPLLAKPILIAAERNVESVRLLMYAQLYHALGHWLVGRGRAARRSGKPDFDDLPPGELAVMTVIRTICSTSRQTITARQIEQLTEPLIALNLDGYARFLRVVLAPAAIRELTRTELEVLRALRKGGTTTEVAERLGKSSHTVLSHLKSACSKIGCSGRAAAVSYAVDRGWLE